MGNIKPIISIVLAIFSNFVLVSCNPDKSSIKPVADKPKLGSSTDSERELMKNLEPMLKMPMVLKESILLHRQCAALTFPNKLLVEALVLTRTNVFKDGNRIKVSCAVLLPENPKGIENLSGDLAIFGVYGNIDYVLDKLPSAYLLNIEQRSEKSQESIYPWFIRKQ